MPSYPFIVQSSKSLDRESRKYVRQHASRFSNAQRRAVPQRDNQRPVIIAPSRKSSSTPPGEDEEQQEQQEQQKARQLSPNASESSEDCEDDCGCAFQGINTTLQRHKR